MTTGKTAPKGQAKPRPAGSGQSHALLAICACFLAAAALKGTVMVGDMLARAPAPAVTDASMPGLSRADPAMASGTLTTSSGRAIVPAAARTVTSASGGGSCEAEPLFAALRTRSGELDAREAALEERAAKVEAAATRVENRIQALREAQADLERTVSHVEEAQSRDIDHLVTMYASMKPKEAGDLFNVMDVHFASEFLARMKPEMAASIMANMDPENAYAASLSLARRNADAPTR